MTKDYVKVGLGVIILNDEGKILLKKRKGSHAPYYSIPGGTLEPGETFEQGAIREIEEEIGITIIEPKVIAITNNLDTFRKEYVHFISVILLVKGFTGAIANKEPDKCDGLLWADPHALPEPHFEASRMGVECYLAKRFYLQ